MESKVKTKNLDFVWLAGLVFVDRDFVRMIDEVGIEEVIKHCPNHDLTEQEKQSFIQAMAIPSLRAVVQDWWQAYGQARVSGELMSPNRMQDPTDDPWAPYLFTAEPKAV